MPTPVFDAKTDNSLRDNTGDAIGGAEVDTNPDIVMKILDASTTTVLGQDGSTGVRFELMGWFEDANAAGSVQDMAFLEWNPEDSGNMTDNASGIGIVWKMPDDADTQIEFASLDVLCTSDATGAVSGEFSFKPKILGTATEVMTINASGVIVGVNDTGHDVQFFGATSGQYMLWDESADELVLAGDSKLSFHDAAGGENIIASSNGHLEVNAGTTLDITAPTVDLNSSTEFNIDTAAYDLNASGAVTIDSAGVSIDSSAASNLTTSGGALTITSATAATWSTSAGALTLNGTGGVNIQEGGSTIIGISDARVLATTNTASVDLDATGAIQVNSSGGAISIANDNVDQNVNLATAGTRTLNIGILDGTDTTTITSKGNQTHSGTITVGVNDTGYDVKLFGATSGAYMLWDESVDDLKLVGAAGLTVAGTSALTVTTASSITGSGVLSTSDATEATSTTAASLKTAGGIAWVKDAYVGDDMFFTSGAVLDFNSGDVLITHSSNALGITGGNVGIGTTDPDGNLHVHKATAGTITAATNANLLVLEDSTHNGMSILVPDGNVANIYFGNATGGNNQAIISWDSDAETDGLLTMGSNKTSAEVRFMTAANSEAVRIDLDGNVGIGVASPSALLEVEKDQNALTNIQIDNNTSGTGAGASLRIDADACGGTLYAFSSGYNTSGKYIADSMLFEAGSTCSGGLALSIDHTTADMSFWTATAQRMTIDGATGNVGIGTATPALPLVVTGGAEHGIGIRVTQQSVIGTDAHLWLGSASAVGNVAQIAFGYDNGQLYNTQPPAVIGYINTSASGYTQGDLFFATRDGTANAAPTEVMRIGSDGNVGIGDTDPNGLLTLNQGTVDTAILTLKSTGDVVTGLGDVTSLDVQTDDYFAIGKLSGSVGGCRMQAMMENSANVLVLDIQSIGGTPQTTKTTAGRCLAEINVMQHDGSNGLDNIDSDGNVFGVRARVGGSSVTRLLVDEDGDLYSVTSAQTFDAHDDVALISAYDMAVAPDSVIRTDFEDFAKYHEEDLIEAGVLGAPVAEGGMTNVTQLQRLHNGAIRQLARDLNETKIQLKEAQETLKRIAA